MCLIYNNEIHPLREQPALHPTHLLQVRSQEVLVAQDDAVYILEPVTDMVVEAFVRAGSASVHTKPRDIDFLPDFLRDRKPEVFPLLGARLQA